MGTVRERLRGALAKPLPDDAYSIHSEVFDPWEDVVQGIHGSYCGKSDDMMIQALEAIRDRQTFEFIDREGFAAEFILYVLSGHRLTEYGTSPRGAWPDPEVADLWQPLIDKWRGYRSVVRGEPSNPSIERIGETE